jgi:hypothetical protein
MSRVTLEALGVGYELAKSVIDGGYSCDVVDAKTASDVLGELLAFQEVETITLGGVSPSLDIDAIAVEIPDGKDVWSSCKTVQETVGGYLQVEIDPDSPATRELWLRDIIGANKGQQIRLGKNLTSINHKADYLQVCNRLYPIGASGLKINTKTFTRKDGVITVDDTYAYLKIQEQYAAYKDWTAAGASCPASVTIEKHAGGWFNPNVFTSFAQFPTFYGDVGWSPSPGHTLADVYDGAGDDLGYYIWGGYPPSAIGFGQGTFEIQAFCPATTTTAIRFWAFAYVGASHAYPVYIVRVKSGGTWETVYSGMPGDAADDKWFTISFTSRAITAVGISVYNFAFAPIRVKLYEIGAWDSSGYTNDTANWKQGADEQTFRLPIASYSEGVGYLASYTHAPYQISLDGVTDRRQIRSRSQQFDVTDIDALLAQGRVALSESLEVASSLTIDMIDLSKIEGYEWEDLQLGSIVRVIHEDLGIDESHHVVRIERPDLHFPELVKLELAARTKTVLDLI